MNRRNFLRYTGISTVALGAGGAFFKILLPRAWAEVIDIHLAIEGDLHEMIDGTRIFVWAFKDTPGPDVPTGMSLPPAPGPVLQAFEGDTLHITVTNRLNEDHGFMIQDVPGADCGVIAPGESRDCTFVVPPAGTYLYLDPNNAPVNRVLGLHGALVIHPQATDIPYSTPTPQVRALFDDLGNSPRFPGSPWDMQRQMIWLFNTIDPRFNQMAQNGTPIDPTDFVSTNLPRYFTINGRNGCDAVHAEDTVPKGKIGQPLLLRILSAGLALQTPHIHGNHIYVIARNGKVLDNVLEKDVIFKRPLDRIDALHPFRQPPDVPEGAWPPREEFLDPEFAQFLEEPKVMRFTMHPHNEISQTAAGGNYPQGSITDWEVDLSEEL